NGTMISASLLGALAGSDALPFTRESYEQAIGAGGRGVKASLAAFGAACDRALGIAAAPTSEKAAKPAAEPKSTAKVSGPETLLKGWQQLAARVAALPEPLRDMAERGLKKVVDYQDIAYGGEYLDRLDKAVALDSAERGYALSIAAAKHLANAMCYDDMIRVADLKTRSTRDKRVRKEVGVKEGSVLQVTEYFHPRIEEFCGTMPAGLGSYIEKRPKLAAFLDRRINRGRHIRTDSFTGFAMLWFIGGLRRWRRRLLRHKVETEHLERWYGLALGHARQDYALATEILNCRRLIKGYSDTHARAQSKFDCVLSALPMLKDR
ncbi:MAG: indolepyruvate oxidoreductase subunit beta family protein, partial [Mesorhizobium sp.]